MEIESKVIETDSYRIQIDSDNRVIVNRRSFSSAQEAYGFYHKQIKMRQAGDDTVLRVMQTLERLMDC